MKLKYIFLAALIFRLILAPLVWHIDVMNHLDWGKRFFEYMPSGFYAPDANVWNFTWPNQPPGAIYIFAFCYILFQFIFNTLLLINSSFTIFPSILVSFAESHLYVILVKLPAILSDLGIALLIYKLLPKKYSRLGAILYLFNPVVWYNSAVWGQTDATINFFALLSFYFLFNKKLLWSFLSFAFCLYIKLSLVIFVPIYLIYLFKNYKLQSLFKSALITFVLLLITTLPFLNRYTQDPFSFLQFVYLKKVLVDQMQVITANAFNFWGAVKGLELQSHDEPFLLFTYKTWGYLLTLLAISPSLYSVYKNQNKENIIWSLAIISFSTFVFLTNMHERYIYPLFPYLTILAAQNKKLLFAYLFISLVTILNMYNLWWVPEIGLIKSILENMTVLRIFSIINVTMFVGIYCYWIRKQFKSII